LYRAEAKRAHGVALRHAPAGLRNMPASHKMLLPESASAAALPALDLTGVPQKVSIADPSATLLAFNEPPG